MRTVLQFLTELNENNNREWFQANRERYQESRDKILFLTSLFLSEIRKFDNDIPVMDPAECLFRIYRDIRFSPDKRPYKTHFGSYISRGGFKSQRAGYYLHIQPGESFLSGGIYMPQPDVLKALRYGIFSQSEELAAITEASGFKRFFSKLEGDKLKKPPKGFPADFPYVEFLKHKSFYVWTPFSDADLTAGDFIEKGVAVFREICPLNSYLNELIAHNL
jgi:uncharacterized protein (TIGR02453 family)